MGAPAWSMFQKKPIRYTTTLDEAVHPMTVLERAVALGNVRHVCLHFRTAKELWRLFRPYFLYHVQMGVPVLYICESTPREDLLRHVDEEGLDSEGLLSRGLLKLIVAADAYLRTGEFSPDRMIAFMESAILDMRAAGHETALLSGEMTWYHSGAPGVDGMILYEERLNELLRKYPNVTIVCNYSMKRFDGEMTLGALCSHPFVQ